MSRKQVSVITNVTATTVVDERGKKHLEVDLPCRKKKTKGAVLPATDAGVSLKNS